jgi:hypothetical protein
LQRLSRGNVVRSRRRHRGPAKFARDHDGAESAQRRRQRLNDMKLFFGNYEFEHQLGPTAPRVLSAQIRRLNAEMAYCLVPLAQPEDCVWAPEPPDLAYSQHLDEIGLPGVRFVSRTEEIVRGTALVPWGWCRSVEDWAAQCGCVCDAPHLATVAQVNSREFSSELEAEWNVSLPGARAIRTMQELDSALAEGAKLPHGWVIKANFGMSARERILVRRSPLRPQEIQWARHRLDRNEPLFFEPWVECLAEFGCQFSVPASGRPLLEDITGLLTDALGTYRGSRLFGEAESRPSNLLPPGVLEVVEGAVQRVQQQGYVGPVGIDVMQYRTSDGEIGWRPLQDINARLTMGRVALGLRRLLGPGERADWLHTRRMPGSATAAERIPLDSGDLSGARRVRTSPLEVGGRPSSHQSALVIARSTERLDAVFSTMRGVHERGPG